MLVYIVSTWEIGLKCQLSKLSSKLTQADSLDVLKTTTTVIILTLMTTVGLVHLNFSLKFTLTSILESDASYDWTRIWLFKFVPLLRIVKSFVCLQHKQWVHLLYNFGIIRGMAFWSTSQWKGWLLRMSCLVRTGEEITSMHMVTLWSPMSMTGAWSQGAKCQKLGSVSTSNWSYLRNSYQNSKACRSQKLRRYHFSK